MMWSGLVALLTLLGTANAWKSFEVPQKARLADKRPVFSYFPVGKSGKTSSDVVGQANVAQVLESLHTVAPRALQTLGLVVEPSTTLEFGQQELCIAASKLISLRYIGAGHLSLETVSTSDHQFRLNPDDTQRLPRKIQKGDIIELQVTLLPSLLGDLCASLYFSTSKGLGIYSLHAYIHPSIFHISPIVLSPGESRAVSLYNPHTNSLRIISISLLPIYDSVFIHTEMNVIASGETEVVFRVRAEGDGIDSVLSVLTNGEKLHIPLRVLPHMSGVKVSPEVIDFGIVSAPKVQHVVKMEVDNYGEVAVEVIAIRSTSALVTVKVLTSRIPAKVVGFPIAEMTFAPRMDMALAGEVNVTLSDSSFLLPQRGFALFSLLRTSPSPILYRYEDDLCQSIVLELNFTRNLTVLSTSFPTPAAWLYPLPKDAILSTIHPLQVDFEVNRSAGLFESTFLSLETEVGIIAIPVFVDDGVFNCEFSISSTKEICDTVNTINLGTLPLMETRHFTLRIKNEGFYPFPVFISRPTSASLPIRVYALISGQSTMKEKMISEDGSPNTFLSLAVGQLLVMECEVTTTEEHAIGSLELHIGQNAMYFTIQWEFLPGRVMAVPSEIRIENAFIGGAQTIPIIVEHSFPRLLHLNATMPRLEGLVITKLENAVSPLHPTHAWDISYPVFPSSSRKTFPTSITHSEVKTWRQRQKNNTQTVSGTIWLFTEFAHSLAIPFVAYLRPPKLAPTLVDFGLVAIRETRSVYITVTNPGEEWMIVQLMLLKSRPCRECDVGGEFTQATQAKIPNRFLSLQPHQKIQRIPVRSGQTQNFFLSPKAQDIVFIRPHDSVVLGPVLMYPTNDEDLNFTLYIRNNLTYFETVELTGTAAFTTFIVTGESLLDEDMNTINSLVIPFDLGTNREKSRQYALFSRRFRITNTGNRVAFLTDVSLEGQFCSLHGIELLTCHIDAMLYPSDSFEVAIVVRANWKEEYWEVNLVLEEGSDIHLIPIRVELPTTALCSGVEVGHQDFAFIHLFLLFVLSLGVMISFLWEIAMKWYSFPLRKVQERLQVSIPLSPLLQVAEKKKPKKHRKKKAVFTLDLSEEQLTAQDQTEATSSSKEDCVPGSVWEKPQVEEIHIETEVNEENSDMESDAESYLDDYRARSGFFSGFRTLSEEM